MQILITRFIKDRHLLKSFTEQKKITLRECPFIDFEYKVPESFPETEWLFFTSKNGILSFPDHFWRLKKSNYKFAVISKGTGTYLREKLVEPDFEGEEGSTTKDIAKDFYHQFNPSSVWFPISNISNKTIQCEAPSSTEIVETITYHTVRKNFQLQKEYDWYVFTSPSNVEGFFGENQIPHQAGLLAIGQQTQEKLKKYTNQKVYLPKVSSEAALLNFFSDI